MDKSREQQLIDLMFDLAITARSSEWCKMASNESIAQWVRHNLEGCGFHTEPMGSSWGVLRDKEIPGGDKLSYPITIVEAMRD